jgi:hypothetical protein
MTTFDNLVELTEVIEEVKMQDDIDKGCLTNEQLNTIEAELCAKNDISTNCNCNNNDDIVILVDTRFERRCIKISIRS